MMTPRVTVALEPDTLRSAQLGALLHGLDLHDYINIVVLQWIQAANGVLLAQPAREQAAPLAEVLAFPPKKEARRSSPPPGLKARAQDPGKRT